MVVVECTRWRVDKPSRTASTADSIIRVGKVVGVPEYDEGVVIGAHDVETTCGFYHSDVCALEVGEVGVVDVGGRGGAEGGEEGWEGEGWLEEDEGGWAGGGVEDVECRYAVVGVC